VQWHPEATGADPAQLASLLAWLEAQVREGA